MEGVKLDITIAERDICNNKLTIENVEARLNKLTEDFGKVSQQLETLCIMTSQGMMPARNAGLSSYRPGKLNNSKWPCTIEIFPGDDYQDQHSSRASSLVTLLCIRSIVVRQRYTCTGCIKKNATSEFPKKSTLF